MSENLKVHTLTLLPAYGRDYELSEEATKDFFSGKDFMCEDSGKYINLEDVINHCKDITRVKLRYKNRALFVSVAVSR